MEFFQNKPSQSQEFHGLGYNSATTAFHGLNYDSATCDFHRWTRSPGSVRLKLGEEADASSSLSLSLSTYHEVPHGEEAQDLKQKRIYQLTDSKVKRNTILGDKAVTNFMKSFRLREQQQQAAALDPKPLAQFDGKQVVSFSSSYKFECTECGKSFSTHQALGGHKSSHYVRDTNSLKNQRDHTCEKCGMSFPTGQALGGHKRFHYEGPPILGIKRRKVSPDTTTTSSSLALPTTSEEDSPNQTHSVKLFGVDLKKLPQTQQDNKGINLDLTL